MKTSQAITINPLLTEKHKNIKRTPEHQAMHDKLAAAYQRIKEHQMVV